MVERLRGAGATIRQVEPLTLEDAALSLLTQQATSNGADGSEILQTIPAGVGPAPGGE